MKKYFKAYFAMVLCISIMMLDVLAMAAPFAIGMGDAKTANTYGVWLVVGFIFGLPLLMALNSLGLKFCERLMKEVL